MKFWIKIKYIILIISIVRMKKMTYNLKLKSLYWLSEEDIENIKSFGVEDLMIIIELMNEAIQYLSETLDIEEIINKK